MRERMTIDVSKTVEFRPFPGAMSAANVTADDLLDDLAGHFWTKPAWVRRWILEPMLAVDGHDQSQPPVFTVSGIPAWIPSALACRIVARAMAASGVEGAATVTTEVYVQRKGEIRLA